MLVIPDIHLKPWMFERAAEIMRSGAAEKAVCLMDIPDEWYQEYNLDLYLDTFESAIRFQNEFPDTLWCYGNHDLSYIWMQPESGFSSYMVQTVNEQLRKLAEAVPDSGQLAYIHRIDDVLFMHGGLNEYFVLKYVPEDQQGDTDSVIAAINSLGCNEMWLRESPIWYRPQTFTGMMYRADDMLQVVGHTPTEAITLESNVLSCDVFSTYCSGEPIGTQEFPVIDTKTWEYITVPGIVE